MNKDLSKYKKIIDFFRGQTLSNKFEALFATKCEHIPKAERFILKMELKRLAGACTRLVDLRGHVDGDCRTYEHEGRVHYLDTVAIKVFEENIAMYGNYTFGVYEAITNTENNFRVIYQKEKEGIQKTNDTHVKKIVEKTQYPASILKFGDYHNRAEERMNFSIPITVNAENNKIICNSSDISVNGCKFRISASHKFTIGQEIDIRFVGLEQEFEFGKVDTFSYQIMNIQLIEDIQLVGVKRIHTDSSRQDGFTSFLKGFIQGNKRRYKVNLENTVTALQARNFEQFILPKLNELPVFITKENLLPKYALTCSNNQNIFEYWQDEDNNSTLNFLITPDRVSRLKKYFILGKPLLIYSFTHKSQGKNFFYTADEAQLKENPKFMCQFLGFAANKGNFAITSLSISDIDINKMNLPFTLSESIAIKDRYLNLPASEEAVSAINSLAYIVTVNDITNKRLSSFYKALPFEGVDSTQLRAYGHKKLSSAHVVENLGINYKNHRQEARFKYETPVDVTCVKHQWMGESQDFSASGIKIKFTDEVLINKGDIVHLSFPLLQKVTSSFDLTKLPYEVMRINKNKNIINLRVYVEQDKHIGKTFFKALISKNKDKLTSDESASIFSSIAKPLRNICSSSIKTPTLVVQTSGSRFKVEAIALGQEYGKLLPLMRQLSDRPGFYNLYPILSNLNGMNLLASNLKKASASDSPLTDILYIAINPDIDSVDKAVTTKLESELNTVGLQKMFIKNALKKGMFFCVQVKISRTDAPNMDYLIPELRYINSYAIHRSKQIEENIGNVAGIIQLIDITQEAMMRVNLSDYLNE